MDNRVKYSWSWLMVICNYAKCKFSGKGHGFVLLCCGFVVATPLSPGLRLAKVATQMQPTSTHCHPKVPIIIIIVVIIVSIIIIFSFICSMYLACGFFLKLHLDRFSFQFFCFQLTKPLCSIIIKSVCKYNWWACDWHEWCKIAATVERDLLLQIRTTNHGNAPGKMLPV